MVKEADILMKIKRYIKNPEQCNEGIGTFIEQNISYISYDALLAQKLIPKIFVSKQINDVEKEEIYKSIILNYKSDKINNYIEFIKYMFPVVDKLKGNISIKIQEHFDSLFVFLYCISMFMIENTEITNICKNLLIKAAYKVLPKDVVWQNAQGKIMLSEEIYQKKKELIHFLYLDAIKCGCVYERFDHLSYLREEVEEISNATGRIKTCIRMVDLEYSNRIMMGSAYYAAVSESRNMEKNEDLIFLYYKCYICKRCYFINEDNTISEWMQKMIERQFNSETMLDMMLRILGKGALVPVILSILMYLYIEQLFLLIFDTAIYKILPYKEIRKNICFNDKISDDEFLLAFKTIFRNEDFISDYFQHPFFRNEQNVVIAKWMFDFNYNIFEETRGLILNPLGNSRIGENANYFGKEVFEGIVKVITEDCGWKVLKSDLKVQKTDFDLVAYKNGNIILGQIKVAHCNREPYHLWKAEKVIDKAINQINLCKSALKSDKYLLYSNLKRERIVDNESQLNEVIYLVITGNSYFAKKGDIPVISIEDLKNILMIEQENDFRFRKVLNDPLSMYNIINKPYYTVSVLDQEEYYIRYDEFEI